MKNMNWKTILAAPIALGALFAVSSSAVAAETMQSETANVVTAESIQLAQVSSVSDLSDVQPSDWAYASLQRLVEEYGCLEGYPDRMFRGDQTLTRYEFAAGLNACLDIVLQVMTPEDGLTGRRLQEEFAAELATLRGRVDALEMDVAELDVNQFSPTTKLSGRLDFHWVRPMF